MKEYTCKRNKLKKRRSSSIESAGQSRDWSIFKAYLRDGGSCGKSACWSQALMMFTKSFGVSAFLAFCATNWANRPNAWSTSSWLCPVRRHEIVASRSTPQRFIWRCTLHFQRKFLDIKFWKCSPTPRTKPYLPQNTAELLASIPCSQALWGMKALCCSCILCLCCRTAESVPTLTIWHLPPPTLLKCVPTFQYVLWRLWACPPLSR